MKLFRFLQIIFERQGPKKWMFLFLLRLVEQWMQSDVLYVDLFRRMCYRFYVFIFYLFN